MKPASPRRRSRSNDGTPNRVSSIIPIDPGLHAKLTAAFYEPIVRRGTRIFHGPRPPSGCPPVKMTDEQILEIRRMYQWHGMPPKAICETTGLPEWRVTQIVQYVTRVHLDPGPRPAEPAQPVANGSEV